MKAATVVGILLIVVGIIGFIAGSIGFTHEKKDVDMGPVQIQHKQTKTVPIPPILGGIALLGGIDQHLSFDGLDLAAVDRQRDGVLLRAWHDVRRA